MRTDGRGGGEIVSYDVPWEPRTTVLQGLLYAREVHDRTLAFGQDCRTKRCGLCGVEVDGKPRLACATGLKRGAETLIGPLRKLPGVRDLVVDRSAIIGRIREHRLFAGLAADPGFRYRPMPASRFVECIDCLCCMDSCPEFDHSLMDRFGGPWLFVKLAHHLLLHGHEREMRERAAHFGVSRCLDCGKGCRCTVGINIPRAISSLVHPPEASPAPALREERMP